MCSDAFITLRLRHLGARDMGRTAQALRPKDLVAATCHAVGVGTHHVNERLRST